MKRRTAAAKRYPAGGARVVAIQIGYYFARVPVNVSFWLWYVGLGLIHIVSVIGFTRLLRVQVSGLSLAVLL